MNFSKRFSLLHRFFLDTPRTRNYTFVSCLIGFCSDWENRQTARRTEPLHKANKAKPLTGQRKANAMKGTLGSVPFIA
jgi:hypothetical protein